MSCLPAAGMTGEEATVAALMAFQFHLPGPENANDLQPFEFSWAVIMLIVSGLAFMGCTAIWKVFEIKDVSRLSDQSKEAKSDPKKKKQIAVEMINYICQFGSFVMFEYVFANIVTLGTMVGLMCWYMASVNYINQPFTIQDFYNWTITQPEDRTDLLNNVFPRSLVFPYKNHGANGSVQNEEILCLSPFNQTLQHMFVAALIFLTSIICLQVISIIFSILIVLIPHPKISDNKTLRKLGYGQRLLYIILIANIDLELWGIINEKVKYNDAIYAYFDRKKTAEQRNKDMLAMCSQSKLPDENAFP